MPHHPPASSPAGHVGTADPGDVTSGPDGVAMQLVRLKRSMESFRTRVLEVGGHRLEGSGLAVLFHLTTAGPMRTSALADLLGLDPSTTSRHVTSLERSGHVERVADPDDGRAVVLAASETGRRAFEDTRALRNALVARALDSWTPQEVDDFAAALARFNDSVQTLDVDSVGALAGSLSTPARKDHR